ncbi:MAG: hypothetical protein ACTSVI_09920 [Promethearchaeota archaeon]
MHSKQISSVFILLLISVSISFSAVYFGFETDRKDNTLSSSRLDPLGMIKQNDDDDIIPAWSDILYSTLVVKAQSEPASSYDNATGMMVNDFDTVFHQDNGTNGTNLNKEIKLSYTDYVNISCQNTSMIVGDNYSVNYFPALLNFSDFNTIRIYNENYSRIYDRTVNLSYFWDDKIVKYLGSNPNYYFKLDLKKAVEVIENTSVYNGSTYCFEFNYTYPIKITNWAIRIVNKPFEINGNVSTHLVEYEQVINFSSWKDVNVSFYFLPEDYDSLINMTFYKDGSEFTAEEMQDFNGTGKSYWVLDPEPPINTKSTGLLIKFGINTTIAFTQILAGRWTEDMIIGGNAYRKRTFNLEVLNGSNSYLIEDIEFNMTDIDFACVKDYTTKAFSEPQANISVINNTFLYIDPELGDEPVHKPNGTKIRLFSIQKELGPLRLSFFYEANYNISLRILDNVRNPLQDASVIIYYEKPSLRYGPKISLSNSLLYPVKITGSKALIEYKYLPSGVYYFEVYYQGNLVKSFNVTTDDTLGNQVIDIVTNVPYKPTLLLIWVVMFAVCVLVGFILYKKKV